MKNLSVMLAGLIGFGVTGFAIAAPATPATGTVPAVTSPAARDVLIQPKGGLTPAVICRPDLTISRMTLTRFGPTRSSVRVTILVRNVGVGTFTSDPRQAGATAVLTNGSTNAKVNLNLGSISQVRAGGTYSMNYISADMPFDTFEFGGEASASINYDPDILIDGQPCNDDRVLANDTMSISNDRIRAWLGTPNNTLVVNR